MLYIILSHHLIHPLDKKKKRLTQRDWPWGVYLGQGRKVVCPFGFQQHSEHTGVCRHTHTQASTRTHIYTHLHAHGPRPTGGNARAWPSSWWLLKVPQASFQLTWAKPMSQCVPSGLLLLPHYYWWLWAFQTTLAHSCPAVSAERCPGEGSPRPGAHRPPNLLPSRPPRPRPTHTGTESVASFKKSLGNVWKKEKKKHKKSPLTCKTLMFMAFSQNADSVVRAHILAF